MEMKNKTKLLALLLVILCPPVSAQSIFDKFEKILKDQNLEINYGPQETWYKRSYITYVHPKYDRDIEFQSVYGHGNDDLDFILKGEFGVPQYKVDIGIDLSENYSLLLMASHLTYEVDVEQKYYRIGEWNGFQVSDSIYLKDDITRLEHSNGMNIWNFGIERKFHIGFKDNEHLDLFYGLTPNVGLVFTASQGSIKNPSNIFEHYNQGNGLSGFNYSLQSDIQLLFKKHYQLRINLNYFQMIIMKAKLHKEAYLTHKLRGFNYGISLGYKF